jgi:hypothetical protein
MKVYIVVRKDSYDTELRQYLISEIEDVYSTEDGAKERLKQFGSRYYDYIEKIVR